MKIEIEVTQEEEKLIKRLAENSGLSVVKFILACVYYFEKQLTIGC